MIDRKYSFFSRKGDVSVLALVAMGVLVLGTIITNASTRNSSQDIRSRAQSSPTLTPIPTSAFTSECGDSAWSCSFGSHFNCANSSTRNLYESVWCCGKERWSYEEANNYGFDPNVCGGKVSKLKSEGCLPQDMCGSTSTSTSPTLTPTTTPDPKITPTQSPPASRCSVQCIYNPGDGSGCYVGHCLDSSKPCSTSINCGYVAACAGTSGRDEKIACDGTIPPVSPTSTLQPTNTPIPTPTIDPIVCIAGPNPCNKPEIYAVISPYDRDCQRRVVGACGESGTGLQNTWIIPGSESSSFSCPKNNTIPTNCILQSTNPPPKSGSDTNPPPDTKLPPQSNFTPECPSGTLVYYSQRDPTYSATQFDGQINTKNGSQQCTLGVGGCGIVTLSMVLSCYKNQSLNPTTVTGTYFKQWEYGCMNRLGHISSILQGQRFVVSGEKALSGRNFLSQSEQAMIRQDLSNGSQIIMAANYFWSGASPKEWVGHIFWVTGMDENGELYVMDPFYGWDTTTSSPFSYPMPRSSVKIRGTEIPRDIQYVQYFAFHPQ